MRADHGLLHRGLLLDYSEVIKHERKTRRCASVVEWFASVVEFLVGVQRIHLNRRNFGAKTTLACCKGTDAVPQASRSRRRQ